jgi:hypothetical protein
MHPTKKALYKKFGRWIIALLLIVAFCVGTYWLTQTLFRITTIAIASSAIAVTVDETRIPKNLLFFPSDRITLEIKQANPLLADIHFQKKFPHTLVIVPVLREPVAKLAATDRSVFVDKEAVVLADDDGTKAQLPTIVVPVVGVRIGETISDKRVVASVGFIAETRGVCSVTTVTVYEGRYLQAKCDSLQVLFTQDTPIASTVATLQTLILGFRIKGTLPSVVDLRFDKPVVRF